MCAFYLISCITLGNFGLEKVTKGIKRKWFGVLLHINDKYTKLMVYYFISIIDTQRSTDNINYVFDFLVFSMYLSKPWHGFLEFLELVLSFARKTWYMEKVYFFAFHMDTYGIGVYGSGCVCTQGVRALNFAFHLMVYLYAHFCACPCQALVVIMS